MPFRNPIIGGASKLIREAIQSPNYVPGTDGWTINRDGSAEFSDVDLRGRFTSLGAIDMRLPDQFSEAILVTALNDPNARWRLQADGHIGWGGGIVTRDTFLYRAAAGVLATDGAFRLALPGAGVQIAEGANARMGLSTLVAGTVVVANTSITANTRIFLTCQVPGGTPGFLRVSARTAGVSFTILSSSATDTSQVAWLLIEPV